MSEENAIVWYREDNEMMITFSVETLFKLIIQLKSESGRKNKNGRQDN